MSAGTPVGRLLARGADWSRAPSAHNTQPWRVRPLAPDRLEVGWDADRVLWVSDPTGRDLLLSLGAVVEALAIVAADEGLEAAVHWHVDHARRCAAEVTLMPARVAGPPVVPYSQIAPGPGAEVGGSERIRQHPSQDPDLLPWGPDEGVSLLRARRTARGRFTGPVTAGRLGGWAETAGAHVVILEDDLVEGLLPVADRWTFDGPGAGELAQWLRLRSGGAGPPEDGLSAEAMGLSGWESGALAIALRPRVLGWLQRAGLTRWLARSATARPVGTVAALLGPPDASDAEIARLGRRLMRVWLAATAEGHCAHPLSQLLDCPSTAATLQQKVEADGTPVAVFRVGMPLHAPPQSGRRPVDDLIDR